MDKLSIRNLITKIKRCVTQRGYMKYCKTNCLLIGRKIKELQEVDTRCDLDAAIESIEFVLNILIIKRQFKRFSLNSSHTVSINKKRNILILEMLEKRLDERKVTMLNEIIPVLNKQMPGAGDIYNTEKEKMDFKHILEKFNSSEAISFNELTLVSFLGISFNKARAFMKWYNNVYCEKG